MGRCPPRAADRPEHGCRCDPPRFLDVGTPGPWFGVPLGNFYGWFMVVASFSLLLRLGRQVAQGARARQWIGSLLPMLAVPVSVMMLLVCLNLYGRLLDLG